MAEHGTRNTTNPNPATGLLFGTAEGIIDAVDVPESAFDTVVALQVAVYPHQQVVGWYRVGKADTPESSGPKAAITNEDLVFSCKLKSRYAEACYFLTLDGTSDVSVFRLEGGNVLINVEFRLETATAERIAVERLLREDKGPAKMNQMNNSIETLTDRLDTLLKYLERGTCDPSNLRRIQSVICNVRFLHASKDPTADIEGLVSLADVVALSKSFTETTRLKSKASSSGSAKFPGLS